MLKRGLRQMRRVLFCVLSLICAAAVGITALPMTAVAASSAIVAADTDLRAGPGNDTVLLGELPQGTQVTVLENGASGWSRVQLPSGKTGYCRADCLVTSALSQYATAVANTYVNVRQGPGTEYAITSALETGAQVDVVDNTNALWARVRLSDGTYGYCNKSALTITPEDPPASSGTETLITTTQAAIRVGAGSYYAAVAFVGVGRELTVLYDGDEAWVQVRLDDGTTGYISKAFVTTKDDTIDTSDADIILPLGKTIYIEGEKNWSSSNPAIASVTGQLPTSSSQQDLVDAPGGFITGVATGKVMVTSSAGTRIVAVVEGEAIRSAYTTPNCAYQGGEVSLIAITDQTRTAVKFEVTVGGEVKTVNASSPVADGNTYVWTGKITLNSAGTFDVKAYSQKNGAWSTCPNGSTSIYVAASSDLTTTVAAQRRISDKGLEFIGTCEGKRNYTYADIFAGNVPTVGYGKLITNGEQYYNNMTDRECMAQFVQTVNNGSYTQTVNQFLVGNHIKFNQQQFDALVSFSYNVGTGWTNSSGVRTKLLGAYAPSSSGTLTAIVTADALNVRDTYSTAGNIIGLVYEGTQVVILDGGQKYGSGWYHVQYGGITGYCSAEYLSLQAGSSGQRDLAYISRNELYNEMTQWHKAGGSCLLALYVRRLDELEIFFDNEYNREWQLSSHNHPSYPLPDCLQSQV